MWFSGEEGIARFECFCIGVKLRSVRGASW
jgi:hypothetical protein